MEIKKKKSISELMSEINKKYKKPIAYNGENSINDRLKLTYVSTGSLAVDIAVGNGGLPLGRIVSIAGQFSSGKSSLALTMIASAQKQGYNCAYIDIEKSFDASYAKSLGVDLDKLLFVSPGYGEEACDIACDIAESGAVNIMVLDSIAALVPNVEQTSSIEDQQMGLQARMLGKLFRRITPILEENQVLLFCINQLREKIGVMYGDNSYETGGNALKYYTSIQMRIMRSMAAKDGKIVDNEGELIGNRHKVTITKNKLSAPFAEANFNIIYGKGIDKFSELLNIGLEHDIIKKKGAFYSFNEINLGQGEANALLFLKNNINVAKQIRDVIVNDIERIQEETKRKAINDSLLMSKMQNGIETGIDEKSNDNLVISNSKEISSGDESTQQNKKEESIASYIEIITENNDSPELLEMIKKVEKALEEGRLVKNGPFVSTLDKSRKVIGIKPFAKLALKEGFDF